MDTVLAHGFEGSNPECVVRRYTTDHANAQQRLQLRYFYERDCYGNFCLFASRGLHFFAQRIRERLSFIAQELKGYDIVGLQEVIATHICPTFTAA